MGSLASERFGQRSERWAALWLRLKGYSIIARRVRNRYGEIDLVCRRGGCLVFVEVKGRASPTAALEALGHHQQRRIAAAAEYFLKDRPILAKLDRRFDLVTITPKGLPRHLTDVWRPKGYG